MSLFTGWLKFTSRMVTCGLLSSALLFTGVSISSLNNNFGGVAANGYQEIFSGSAHARPGGRGASRGGHRGAHRHRAKPPRRQAHRKHRRADNRRDHRRRVVRRRHALGFLYVATLPTGCSTTVVVDGVRYYVCDSIYYRPYIDNGVTIYVIKE